MSSRVRRIERAEPQYLQPAGTAGLRTTHGRRVHHGRLRALAGVRGQRTERPLGTAIVVPGTEALNAGGNLTASDVCTRPTEAPAAPTRARSSPTGICTVPPPPGRYWTWCPCRPAPPLSMPPPTTRRQPSSPATSSASTPPRTPTATAGMPAPPPPGRSAARGTAARRRPSDPRARSVEDELAEPDVPGWRDVLRNDQRDSGSAIGLVERPPQHSRDVAGVFLRVLPGDT
jgi:hypothetical protein